MKPTSHSSLAERENAAERAKKIFELYKMGATYAQAGAANNMTESAARRALLRVLRGVPTTDVREQRNIMLERFQAMRYEAWNILNRKDQTDERKLHALDRLIKIEKGVADILGLKKLVVKVQDDGSSAPPIEWARNLLARYRETLANQKEVIVERPAQLDELEVDGSSEFSESTDDASAASADDDSDAIEVLPGAPLDFSKNGKGE